MTGKSISIYFSPNIADLIEFESRKKGLSSAQWIKQLVEKKLGLELCAEEIAKLKSKLAKLENEQRRMRYESIKNNEETNESELLSDFDLVGTHLKKIDYEIEERIISDLIRDSNLQDLDPPKKFANLKT